MVEVMWLPIAGVTVLAEVLLSLNLLLQQVKSLVFVTAVKAVLGAVKFDEPYKAVPFISLKFEI